MTDLRDAFVDKQMKRLEDKSFGYLRKNGIYNLAVTQFEKQDLPDSRIVRNAFLLNFEKTMKGLSAINPDVISQSDTVASLSYGGAQTLRRYAVDNEDSDTAIDNTISESMLAASICANAVNGEYSARDYIGLIGSDAYLLVSVTDKIRENPDYFSKGATSPEERCLHLARVIDEMNLAFKASQHEVEKTGSVRPNTARHAHMIIEHIDDLGLRPQNSTFEEYVINKRNTLEQDLSASPVTTPGTVINLFDHS